MKVGDVEESIGSGNNLMNMKVTLGQGIMILILATGFITDFVYEKARGDELQRKVNGIETSLGNIESRLVGRLKEHTLMKVHTGGVSMEFYLKDRDRLK